MTKKIVGLTCTNGRFSYLERLLACFINQNYLNKKLLIYNNATIPLTIEPTENIILINNHTDLVTGNPYSDVGSIYRDALTFIPVDTDYVSIMDDDDIFLPNHLVKGVKRLSENPQFKVWKPGYYFYKYSPTDVEYVKTDNNLEGSCIIDYNFLRDVGFEINTSLNYNLQWLKRAIRDKVYYEDNDLEPTFCCEYGQRDIIHSSTYSTLYPNKNRLDIEKEVQKIGDYGIGKTLTPWPREKLLQFFNMYFNLENFFDL